MADAARTAAHTNRLVTTHRVTSPPILDNFIATRNVLELGHRVRACVRPCVRRHATRTLRASWVDVMGREVIEHDGIEGWRDGT